VRHAQCDIVVVIIVAKHCRGNVGTSAQKKLNEADVATSGRSGKELLAEGTGVAGRSSGRV
jgi:hypothetical protein